MKRIFFAAALFCCLNTVAFANGNNKAHKASKQATKKEAKTSNQSCYPSSCPKTGCSH